MSEHTSGIPSLTPVKSADGWRVCFPITGSIGRSSVLYRTEAEAQAYLDANYPVVMRGKRDRAAGLALDDNPYPMTADQFGMSEPQERIDWRHGWQIAAARP